MLNGFTLNRLALVPRCFPVFESAAAPLMPGLVALHILADNLAMAQISGLGRSIAQKLLSSRQSRRLDRLPASDLP